ncbi:hypothetical protein PRUPE_3G136200 [Prunus persica]|uniref:Uncharacterized protein n=1 Tax=Prunus persica TaxID=3760 RepID=A0A251PZX8_PRUPE|nr:hypothetical protein PRUPE_3G136200 [Prunus persica]
MSPLSAENQCYMRPCPDATFHQTPYLHIPKCDTSYIWIKQLVTDTVGGSTRKDHACIVCTDLKLCHGSYCWKMWETVEVLGGCCLALRESRECINWLCWNKYCKEKEKRLVVGV